MLGVTGEEGEHAALAAGASGYEVLLEEGLLVVGGRYGVEFEGGAIGEAEGAGGVKPGGGEVGQETGVNAGSDRRNSADICVEISESSANDCDSWEDDPSDTCKLQRDSTRLCHIPDADGDSGLRPSLNWPLQTHGQFLEALKFGVLIMVSLRSSDPNREPAELAPVLGGGRPRLFERHGLSGAPIGVRRFGERPL